MINPGQIKKIHTIKSALSLDDDTYRELLFNSFRVVSSKQLNFSQAEDLIREMEKIAIASGVWDSCRKKRQGGGKFEELNLRRGMATPAQLRKIEAMWSEISRIDDIDARQKGLRTFLERIAKVSALRFLDSAGAGKVINALNAMTKQENVKQPKKTYKPFSGSSHRGSRLYGQ